MNSLWEFTLQIPSTVEQKRELEHGKEVYIYYNDEKVFSGIVGQIRHDEPDVGIIQVGRYHVSWQLGWMIFATSYAWSPDYELYGLDPNKITYPGVSATRILDDIIDCALFKGINDYAREVCPTGIIAMQFGYEKCGYDPEHPPGAVARLALSESAPKSPRTASGGSRPRSGRAFLEDGAPSLLCPSATCYNSDRGVSHGHYLPAMRSGFRRYVVPVRTPRPV